MKLIMGASGTAGSRIARRLLDRGERVRAVSRDRSRLVDLDGVGAEFVRGDLWESGWMEDALRGVRSVVLSSHGLVPPTRDNHPEIVDGSGNRRIIDAAKRAGVEHVVFVSAALSGETKPLFGQIKRRVEEYLKASGIPYTIVRPTVFIETHALRLLAEPLLDKGRVIFFGPGTTLVNWVSAEDVADYVVRALHEPELRDQTATIGGPDVLSRLQALEVVERVLGRQARRSHVPVPVMRAVRFAVGAFHPGMRYLLDIALDEASHSGDGGSSPPPLDWTGPTTLRQIVGRWADQTAEAQTPAAG
jgi:uncharacterized protein YbjT (DUF2867 family)